MLKKEDIANATVHFVSGKGGVGKSLVAQALASSFADRGYKTLRVQLFEQESQEGMRVAPLVRESANLYYLNLFPDQATYEYLALKIPQKRILNSLLSKKLFRALLQALPGLSDLTRLGKIWFHADPKLSDEREVFQKIIVDMPSSGFVKRFLSVARVVSEAVKVGPLAKEAKLVEQYFSKGENALLHIVSVPEDLIMKESLEFINDMLKSKSVPMGYLFINRWVEIYKTLLKDPMLDFSADFLVFMHARAKAHEQALEELLKISLPQVLISEQWGEVDDKLVVAQLAGLHS